MQSVAAWRAIGHACQLSTLVCKSFCPGWASLPTSNSKSPRPQSEVRQRQRHCDSRWRWASCCRALPSNAESRPAASAAVKAPALGWKEAEGSERLQNSRKVRAQNHVVSIMSLINASCNLATSVPIMASLSAAATALRWAETTQAYTTQICHP